MSLTRYSLREHNLWLQRYGHSSSSTPVPNPTPPTRPSAATASSSIPEYTVPIAPAPSSSSVPPYSAPSSSSAVPTASSATPEYTAIASGIVGGGVGASTDLPAYSASDVPPYTGGGSTRDEVQHRALQITEWLAEGEDLLREYSTRFAQLGEELGMGFEDGMLNPLSEIKYWVCALWAQIRKFLEFMPAPISSLSHAAPYIENFRDQELQPVRSVFLGVKC